MKPTSKCLTILLIITLACSISSLMVMTAACADPPPPTVKPNIPRPSVPQFTVTYADHSFDVPAKTTSNTDPYTGKVTTTTVPGYRFKNFTIDISIRNQQYPATVNNGNTSELHYSIQKKGHFETQWVDINPYEPIVATKSESTLLSIPAEYYPAGGKIDIRVSANLGFRYVYFYGLLPMGGFASETSGWSNPQTVTIPGAEPTSNPTITPIQPTTQPTIAPSNPQTSAPTTENNLVLEPVSVLIAVVIVLVAIIVALVGLFYRKTRIH
jgi:hypothetical protein